MRSAKNRLEVSQKVVDSLPAGRKGSKGQQEIIQQHNADLQTVQEYEDLSYATDSNPLYDDLIDEFDSIQKEQDAKVRQRRLDFLRSQMRGTPSTLRPAAESAEAIQAAPITPERAQAERRADTRVAFYDQEKADKGFAARVKSEVSAGQGGQRVQVEGETIGVPTTNAPFMQQENIEQFYKSKGLEGPALEKAKSKITRPLVEWTLRNIQNGKPLTAGQQQVWDYLKATRGRQEKEQNADIDTGLQKIEKAGLEVGQPRKLAAGNIAKGDKVVMDKGGSPDLFTSRGIDESGEVVLEDGVTVRVDPFDEVEVLAHKKGEKNGSDQQEQPGVESVGPVERASIPGAKQETGGEPGPAAQKVEGVQATLKEMVDEAARWQGAARKASEVHKGDTKASLAHMRQTTKGDLDAYLMGKYNLDSAAAREVSNTLTRDNIKADETAAIEEFKGQPWADEALSKAESAKTDLSKITVMVKVVREVNGEEIQVEENAKIALDEIDQQVESLDKLLNCVAG